MSARALTADLIAEIEAALEDAERASGTYADDPQGWHARHRVEMANLVIRLEPLGLRCNDRWDGARVRCAGVTASSTTGIAGALRNWLRAARGKQGRA